MEKQTKPPISIPALRGRMGDWYYYVGLMTFEEVAKRVSLPAEIDEYEKDENKLGEWIQRDLNESRIASIVRYIKSQKQRFFNSIILGIYGGEPHWRDITINTSNSRGFEEGISFNYLNRTFGILHLEGSESIFAVDGQHRAIGIREAVKAKPKLASEEVAVIFIPHQTTNDGKIRTRRLFSTLNRYAKPVNKKEIIALSEDDNCAIITRRLIETNKQFSNKIILSGTKSVHVSAKSKFTTIIVLYEIVERILTNKVLPGFPPKAVTGKDRNNFTTERELEEDISKNHKHVATLLNEVIITIPSLSSFFIEGKEVDRTNKDTSLLFRPIGQKVFFDVLKAGLIQKKKKAVLKYFEKDDFNLSHKIWKRVFWDSESETILTEAYRQRYASLLIMESIGIPIKRTKKDREIHLNFGLDPSEI